MVRASALLLTGLLLVTALGGCKHTGDCGGACQQPPAPDVASVLPAVLRGRMEPALQVQAAAAIAGSAQAPEEATPYYALTPMQCQCQAVRAAAVANLLDRESQAAAEQARHGCLGHKGDQAAELKRDILTYSALEYRNQTAAAALNAYFQLAEAEGRWELLQTGLKEVGEALARSRDMVSKGLKPPVEPEVFQRKQLEFLTDRTELQLSIEQLNNDLTRLLGLKSCQGSSRFWPVLESSGPCPPIDCAAAVAVGLANRPELALLREVSQKLNDDTLPAVRQLLGSVNPLLGMAQKTLRCPPLAKLAALLHHSSAHSAEVEARREQVEQYRAEREETVQNDIRADVRAVALRSQVVALARKRAESWRARVRDLEEKQSRGIVTFAETNAAKLEWLRARGEIVKAVSAWERARVKLKLDQGILALECDYAACSPGPAAVTDAGNTPCTVLP